MRKGRKEDVVDISPYLYYVLNTPKTYFIASVYKYIDKIVKEESKYEKVYKTVGGDIVIKPFRAKFKHKVKFLLDFDNLLYANNALEELVFTPWTSNGKEFYKKYSALAGKEFRAEDIRHVVATYGRVDVPTLIATAYMMKLNSLPGIYLADCPINNDVVHFIFSIKINTYVEKPDFVVFDVEYSLPGIANAIYDPLFSNDPFVGDTEDD